MRGRRAAFLALASALTACGDPAFDAAFRGRDATFFFGAMLADEATSSLIAASAGGLRGLVSWGAPDGETLVDRGADFVIVGDGEWNLYLYAPPPERFLRAAEQGRVALGQLAFYLDDDGDGTRDATEPLLGQPDKLLAWSPAGAAGGIVIGELAAGWQLVHPSVPCDVMPLGILPLSGRETKPLFLRGPGSVGDPFFFAPGCQDQIPVGDHCPSLVATRWWCRHGPRTAEVCDRCEYRLFPEGADAPLCDRWFERCLEGDELFWFEECWVEWRVCVEGEAPRTEPCDLTCACAKLAASCQEPDARCRAEVLAGCNWQDEGEP